MNPLIEAVTSAFREGKPGGLRACPEWHDLSVDERAEAFEQTVADRALEAALDPHGLSPTAHAVLARIRVR